jgi:hypothetical protein
MTPIRLLSADDKHAEIKRLYYSATRQTIQQDLDKAVNLLKSMANEDERDRAAVYMDGLAQMRTEWARSDRAKAQGRGKLPKTGATRTGNAGTGSTGKKPKG